MSASAVLLALSLSALHKAFNHLVYIKNIKFFAQIQSSKPSFYFPLSNGMSVPCSSGYVPFLHCYFGDCFHE